MVKLIGLLAGVLLALSGIPQAITVVKAGRADGLDTKMMSLLIAGVFCLGLYVYLQHGFDIILHGEYLFTISVWSTTLYYKLRPRRRPLSTRTVTCKNCGWVHMAVSRDYAVAEYSRFNEYFDGLPKKTQEECYGGKGSGMQNYDRCDRCGGPYYNFREAKSDDCPIGCTIGPILDYKEVEPKKLEKFFEWKKLFDREIKKPRKTKKTG